VVDGEALPKEDEQEVPPKKAPAKKAPTEKAPAKKAPVKKDAPKKTAAQKAAEEKARKKAELAAQLEALDNGDDTPEETNPQGELGLEDTRADEGSVEDVLSEFDLPDL